MTLILGKPEGKICARCKEWKGNSHFSSSKRNKDGWQSYCRECHKIIARAWGKAHPEKRKESHRLFQKTHREHFRNYQRKYYQETKEKQLAQAKARYKLNAEEFKAKGRKYHKSLKGEVFNAYGGYICVCCGEIHELFLCIDHINNDGNRHRKYTLRKGDTFYLWLKRNGFPPGFQVLCFNCNWGKAQDPEELERIYPKVASFFGNKPRLVF